MKKGSDLNRPLSLALSVSAGAASVLPDPAIISIFGLVFFT